MNKKKLPLFFAIAELFKCQMCGLGLHCPVYVNDIFTDLLHVLDRS